METLIQKLWKDYRKITPTIIKVKHLLNVNDYHKFCDHIAFRTINTEGLDHHDSDNNFGIQKISEHFLKLGYTIENHYVFTEKNLKAVHLSKENSPRIFISELLLHKFSKHLQDVLIDAFKQQNITDTILTAGRNWKVNYKIYNELRKESEYASWLYIHGHRVNHFTINVNRLQGYSIENVCAQLKTSGIKLNHFGNMIKGNKKLGLKQASTMADEVHVVFEDIENPIEIPSCYVEFAERFMVNNKMFDGFITSSADKIFQSTNKVA